MLPRPLITGVLPLVCLAGCTAGTTTGPTAILRQDQVLLDGH